MAVLPVGPLAHLAAVDHEAAPGANRELGDACAAFGAAAVAACLDLGGGDLLLLLGRFGGRVGRGHLLGGRGGGWKGKRERERAAQTDSSDKSRGILSYLNGAYRSGFAEGAAQNHLAQLLFVRKAGG